MTEIQVESGAQLGKYKILGTLGRGSMGVVYRAEDPEIGRTVAIKTLRKLEGKDPQKALERFRTEARSAGRLRHPNIITVFDASIEGDTPFIVMDYVEGEGLDVVLGREGKLDPRRALAMLRQLADALDEAHRQGVIHRDIKPSNLVVDKQDRLYVLDFGVARLNETIQEAGATTGEEKAKEPVMGTPAYMSPEQILNRPLDPRSDLFSFSLVAYELLAGQRPFPGQNFKEVVSGILNSPPVPISSILADVPLQVEVEFEHALAKNPNDRFGSAIETVRVFEKAFFGQEGVAARGSGVVTTNQGSSKGTEWKSIGVPKEIKNEQPEVKTPEPAAPEATTKSEQPSSLVVRDDPNRGARRDTTAAFNKTTQARSGFQAAYHAPGDPFAEQDQEVVQRVRFRSEFSFVRAAILLFGIFAICSASFMIMTLLLNKSPQQLLGLPDPVPEALIERQRELTRPIRTNPVKVAVGSENLASSPGELSDDELFSLLTSDKELEVGRLIESLKVAQQRKIPGLLPAALRLLKHDSYALRLVAIEVIGGSKDRSYAPHLLQYLEDYDPLVRAAVAKAIANLGSGQSVAYLKRRYRVEDKDAVKGEIKKAIESITGLPLEST